MARQQTPSLLTVRARELIKLDMESRTSRLFDSGAECAVVHYVQVRTVNKAISRNKLRSSHS